MHELRDCHKKLANHKTISFFSKSPMSRSLSAMRNSLLFLIFLAFGCVSCWKKKDEPAAVEAVDAPTKPTNGRAPSPSLPKPADDSQDLANQLRDPDVLNQLEGTDQQNSNKESPKPLGSQPVIIKGSDLPPVLPNSQKPTPVPPISKPKLPSDQ